VKIVYLIGEALDTHPGLADKIGGQTAHWRAAGHEVQLLEHRDRAPADAADSLAGRAALRVRDGAGRAALFARLSLQYRFAREQLARHEPDLVYTRYLFPAPGVGALLRGPFPVVVEVNSDDRSEYLQRGRITGLYNSLARRAALRGAAGAVFVTRELAASPSFSCIEGPRLVLANGIDLSQVTFAERTTNEVPQLAFVGSPGQAWHGLDKLGTMAANLPGAVFHVIGPSREECERVLGGIPGNVRCHGYLPGAEVDALLAGVDFGIGSLALHRNAMDEACPLKVRRYLAHGLPVISGCRDTDIDGDRPFFLELENSEDNVRRGRARIEAFVAAGFRDEALRRVARTFAERELTEEEKERRRLEFLEQIAARSARAGDQ